MTLAALAQDTVEKRAVSRHRVLLGAKLVWGQNAFTPECVIRNLTPRGCSVRISPELRLPPVLSPPPRQSSLDRRALHGISPRRPTRPSGE